MEYAKLTGYVVSIDHVRFTGDADKTSHSLFVWAKELESRRYVQWAPHLPQAIVASYDDAVIAAKEIWAAWCKSTTRKPNPAEFDLHLNLMEIKDGRAYAVDAGGVRLHTAYGKLA